MLIVFVSGNKELSSSFLNTFHQTNRVYLFDEMFEAYKWIKHNNETPDIIISELDLDDPTGLQTIKFLETKSKLRNTKIVVITEENPASEQISLIVSEGADAVFSRKDLLKEIGTYIKYMEVSETKKPHSRKSDLG